MGVQGQRVLSSEIFIESIPDDFVQIADEEWRYDEGSHEVPVILPRSYINMYNFGYAQTHSMPKINDGLVSMIDFELNLRGNGHDENFHGRVVGFSNRLSSILVPQTFMLWSNSYFAPDNQQQPTRLIVEVNNPTDERIAQFLEDKGYEVETEQLDAEKTTYLLKVIVSIVIVIGLIISVLSFYILMLSIYLLVQKNTEKLQNLMLIGYTPRTVAWPYQCLTIVLNAVVLIIAIIAVIILRRYYMSIIESIYPQLADSSILPAVIVGLVIFLVVSLINAFVIHRKMTRLWRANND
jgi:ABC-type antimicrobial peptide transport system permease subunit